MPTLLDAALLEETLHSLPGWSGGTEAITREFHLAPQQLELLTQRVDVDATALGHHPQVTRTSDGARFVLTSEEEGGVTEIDIALASHISDLAHRLATQEPGVEAQRHDAPEVTAAPPTDAADLPAAADKAEMPVRY